MSNTNALVFNPPKELMFNGPADKFVISCLSITNPTKHAIYFKMKTTAPLHYNAYPQIGVIQPGSTEEIEFERQPADQNAYSDPSRHLFMVQSAYAINADIPAEDFWKTVDLSKIMSSNLQAAFSNDGFGLSTTFRSRLAGSGDGIQHRLPNFEDDPLWAKIDSQTNYGVLMIQIVLVAVAILLTGIIVGALL